MKPHAHSRGRLSTPSVCVCDCGAISIRHPEDPCREEWLSTEWAPPPVQIPPPPVARPPDRRTTPLPLLARLHLTEAGWDVG